MSYELIAGVDLGSNSFRLQIGRVVGNRIHPLDTFKENVRLGSGLTREKLLDHASQQRAIEALRRFGERLRGFDPETVRAVTTDAMRVARNARIVLPQAEAALGFPIEVIGGREEARLIFIGAANALPAASHRRLVVDIGGGSTEFIIGENTEPLLMESLFMGGISYRQRFFPEGKVDKKRFYSAEVAAAREVEAIAADYQRFGWLEAVGSSGSAQELADILEMNDLNPEGISGISREGLARLRQLLIRAGSAEALGLQGMRSDRMMILPGAIAIMSAVFSELAIEHMTYSDGALPLGVLYDLLGRFEHHDTRDETVLNFRRRYQVDAAQVRRVEQTALALLGQLIKLDSPEHENNVHFLRWAISLHEIGVSVAHTEFHKHGAYILGHADMPGFSKRDQARLALLVLGQRGKLQKLAAMPIGDPNWRLVFCLRLAVLLHRARDAHPFSELSVLEDPVGFQLDLPVGWQETNPMMAAALAEEALLWRRIGIKLRIRSTVPGQIAVPLVL
ncbi:MAG TPA: Ppx/GppA phosphatase family protein [Accumulibacter sp.]|uniref:Exopolyphosphatase n=2 Tax=Candidatus Accumulibacter TaxID=327159 RepID=A0A080MBY1_9PROT|nr:MULTISPECIES: Ppx/GppA phosphatase family protein [Candidatus Accumulibacter]KFB78456.1 MAG: Exopolyphosphatase [Candidatus Accumulibacter cognatus]MBL8400791.1 Ppx/GppA family phosphatase [Accumulibacter sp.]MBN8516954.1 Ppx/GppA family phosphatase [Accumulibacter sp.]MCC2866554.1 Ppx/GppA family phosphatase [Candidatus Accumulibacter phosphatis]MCM8580295.1 Ppx/GppA family phosphatase [Accumulibacter sp.]